jgi:hypothetical protein
MPFIKLDCDILESSLWDWTPERHIFITALLMAKPHELTKPEPQLKVDSLDPTGWVVPPGKYGFIKASGSMIIKKALTLSHMNHIEESEDYTDGLAALKALGSPDPDSRSQEFDGRRLVRVDGGYIALNFQRFRDKDHTATERKRRQRQREKESGMSRRDVTESHTVSLDVTQAEAEADKNIRLTPKGVSATAKKPRSATPRDDRTDHPSIQAVREIVGRYPDKALWDTFIETLGDTPDTFRLKTCFIEWRKKGWNPTNNGWAFDWYINGITEKNNGKNQQNNGRTSTLQRIADHAEIIAQYPTEAELRAQQGKADGHA